MKESTKTEEVKMEEITKESLSNLSKGYFHVPISKGQTEKISSSLKMREYWGVPRPFGGEFGDDPFIEGFLYLWFCIWLKNLNQICFNVCLANILRFRYGPVVYLLRKGILLLLKSLIY